MYKNQTNYLIMGILLFTALPQSAVAGSWHEHWHHHYKNNHIPTFSRQAALPDRHLTPGVRNPKVTQSNIYQTICVRGYTRTIRPPEHYTESLKRKQIRQYGYPAGRNKLWFFEEDHLMSLELGGSPTSPQNLWPEPLKTQGGWGAHTKDRLENRLNHMVCDGQMSLRKAQHLITHNWIKAYRAMYSP